MLDMMKRHEIQVLRRAGHSQLEVAKLAGTSERTVRRVEDEPAVRSVEPDETRRRGIGRPSKAEAFRLFVTNVLAAEPDVLSLEILRRARLDGYEGGKSALYALIATLRPKPTRPVVRFEGLPGEFSQHDFGHVDVRFMDGGTKRIHFDDPTGPDTSSTQPARISGKTPAEFPEPTEIASARGTGVLAARGVRNAEGDETELINPRHAGSGAGRTGAWKRLHAMYRRSPERVEGSADENQALVPALLLANHWELLEELASLAAKDPAWRKFVLERLSFPSDLLALRQAVANSESCPARHRSLLCRSVVEAERLAEEEAEGLSAGQ